MSNPVKPHCRLCLAPSSGRYASIDDPEVRCKLDVVFKFELPLEESLSDVVCCECNSKVVEFYSFHETVRTHQVQLRKATSPDTEIFLQVEVKEEQMDDEEPEEIKSERSSSPIADEAPPEKDDDDVDDADYEPEDEPPTKSDAIVSETTQSTDDQGNKSNRMPDDNWRIEQFFGGITCSICSEKFQTFGKLKTHSRRTHAQKASITCCKKKFFKKCYLIQHINSHEDSKHFYCELCKKNYGSKYYLTIHKLQVHADPEELPHQCKICHKKFSRESLLTGHLKMHVQVKCSVCDRTMASIYTLRMHMLKMHSDQPPIKKTHVCDKCGQVYNFKQSLEKHINLQHMEGENTDRIQCAVCTKWVNSKHYLKVHMRNAHSGEDLKVMCTICRQVCANKRALSTHKNKVHADRTFECEICGKIFKLAKHLKEHRAAHLGQQLYTCSLCGYGTNYNGNLYTHIKNKHPVEQAVAKVRGESLMVQQSADASGAV